MIQFVNDDSDPRSLLSLYPGESAEYEFLNKLIKSDYIYRYSSKEELLFETEMRRNIINASYALYRGRLAFRTFRESKCNELFWDRRPDGGFVLKRSVKPADAVNDIFRNTRMYGTECATAVVMIYYKAVLDAFSDNLFNDSFSNIVLMNWIEVDDLLGVVTYRGLPDYVPGDCRYFRNPDVNPLTPEWQGENAIDLGKGMYYGHGIGIATAGQIIEALNMNRIEDSQVSAYLMDNATRPNFKKLYRHKKNYTQ